MLDSIRDWVPLKLMRLLPRYLLHILKFVDIFLFNSEMFSTLNHDIYISFLWRVINSRTALHPRWSTICNTIYDSSIIKLGFTLSLYVAGLDLVKFVHHLLVDFVENAMETVSL
jgi:hypothetical protein